MQQQDKVYRTELTPLSFLRRSAYVFLLPQAGRRPESAEGTR
jgi:hypothetical protein